MSARGWVMLPKPLAVGDLTGFTHLTWTSPDTARRLYNGPYQGRHLTDSFDSFLDGNAP